MQMFVIINKDGMKIYADVKNCKELIDKGICDEGFKGLFIWK